jgi:cyclohexanecarboxylate-CoA ligase
MRHAPDACETGYYAAGFWIDKDLWASFAECAKRNAERVAFVAGGRSLRFDELLQSAAAIGAGLRAQGVLPGDVVVIHARTGIESVQAMLACAHAGAVMTPVPPMFSVAQLTAVCTSAKASAMIALGEANDVARAVEACTAAHVRLAVVPDALAHSPDVLAWSRLPGEAADAQHVPVDPDALALLVYSSGTTGAPKGVMHSANTVRYAIEQRALLHGVAPGDVSLVVSQFGFVGCVVFGLLFGAMTGITSVLMRSWDGDAAIRLIEAHGITYGLLMPTHVHDVLSSPLLATANVTSFRRCGMGGLTRERRLEVKRRLCPQPLPAYGMSECLGYTTCAVGDRDDKELSTDGIPYPGTHTMVVDDAGVPVEQGVTGAIIVRGPSRFLGYYGAPELTQRALTQDGYYRTGDMGWLDSDGYITFVARQNDIIRRGGINIVPGDLESVLMKHPRIEHVAVVGLPDARLGERGCACVITRDRQPMAIDELTKFLEEQGVARYTWPERVEMFMTFPRSASLKVQKGALIAQLTKDAT